MSTPENRPAYSRRGTTGEGRALLEVEGLSFAYDTEPVLAVDGLSIHTGDVAVLTGHNGSGKTTLLKVLNGLLSPSEGVVRLWGESIATGRGRSLLRSRSVLVHQRPYLFHESVEANIRYVVKLREPGARDIDARIAESLAAVRLEGFAHRRATGLSGGEKQRVAIARALAVRPELLLLDEPTSNIDPESIRAIEGALGETNRRGTTIVITTHNVATAYRLATSVYPMEAGRMHGDRNAVFRGDVEQTDEYFTYFRVDGGSVIRTPAQSGHAVAAVIPMDDIIVSTEPLRSSAQNHFRGRVAAVEPYEGGRRVDVDCNGVIMPALVTPYAVEQLGLRPGAEVHLAFKASAVRLY
ncbi:MAG: ATP-binding cassette domain-containing protein [Spirochaetia bacterium]